MFFFYNYCKNVIILIFGFLFIFCQLSKSSQSSIPVVFFYNMFHINLDFKNLIKNLNFVSIVKYGSISIDINVFVLIKLGIRVTHYYHHTPNVSVSTEVKAKIAKEITNRYNPHTKCLDLSHFHSCQCM